jgi:hypothetical protein
MTQERQNRSRGLGGGSAAPSALLGFSDVNAEEQARILGRSPGRRRSETHGFDQTTPQKDEPETVGLSLSGGGIRSAAFSLGLLQGLEAQGKFGSIDYLSTVSGGGYAGAALIAGMARANGKFPFKVDESTITGETGADIADNADVRGIRDRCRYLMPNGWFDFVVSTAVILRGLVVNAVMVAATIFMFAGVTLIFNPTVASLEHAWPYYLGAARLEETFGRSFLLTKVFGLAVLAGFVVWAVARSIMSSGSGSLAAMADVSPRAAIAARALIVLAVIFVCECQPLILAWLASGTGVETSLSALSGTLATLTAGTGLFAVFWRTLVNWVKAAAKDSSISAYVQSISSKLTLLVLGLMLPLLIYCCYLWVSLSGLRNDAYSDPSAMYALAPAWVVWWAKHVGVVAPSFALVGVATTFALWSVWVGPVGATVFSKTWWRRPEAWMTVLGAAIAVAMLSFVLWFAVSSIKDIAWSAKAVFLIPCTYLVIGFLLAVVGGFFTANANSLHRLYRDRLNEAFRLGGIDPAKSFALDRLKDCKPYLIVNAAANMQASQKNGRRRAADFFVFTPERVGSDATGYVRTQRYQRAEPNIDLATVVAISGAAVSSAMGKIGIPILAPTLSLLNIRLGYWVRNPNRLVRVDAARLRKDDFFFPYLWREMFGLLDEKKSKVLLSDGGHIDNLGLYQLLKRRCKVIIVSDAEADPAMTFSSFVDVERYARIDLGVRLNIPVKRLTDAALNRQDALKKGERPAARSPAWAHAVVGTINYPNEYVVGNPQPIRRAETGYLIYVKASVTGNERNYILDYERRYPAFPHESTGDQFFSEEQFEAYRALGFHAMTSALTENDNSLDWYTYMREINRVMT